MPQWWALRVKPGELSLNVHTASECMKCSILSTSCWRRHSKTNPQYIFFRCLILKTLHFVKLPICQSPVKRWIHFSKFWKSHRLLGIMNRKGKWKENWGPGREVSWTFTSEIQRLSACLWLNNTVYITNTWEDLELLGIIRIWVILRDISFTHYSV